MRVATQLGRVCEPSGNGTAQGQGAGLGDFPSATATAAFWKLQGRANLTASRLGAEANLVTASFAA